MNAALFWRGTLLALVLCTLAAAGMALFAPLTGNAIAMKLMLLGVATAGLIDQLLRSAVAGRILAAAGWLALAAALLLIDPPLWLWLALPVFALWLQRALALHRRPLLALVDAALVLVGLAAAMAAARHSGSVWLALWCFLLAQALAVAVSAPSSPPAASDRFTAARRSAESALRALHNDRPAH